MNTDALTFAVVCLLVGFAVVKSGVIQKVGRWILVWANLPDDDQYSPWRIRLVFLVLLYPVVSMIITVTVRVTEVIRLNIGPSDFPWFLFRCIETFGDSLHFLAWLGLTAYGALRRSTPSKIQLLGWVIGYWTIMYTVLSLLLAAPSSSISIQSLRFACMYVALCTLMILLSSLWFWLAAKSIRTMLIAAGEENDSKGLSIQDILWSIFVFALSLSGFQFLSKFFEAPEFHFKISFEEILIGPLLSCILIAWMMAIVFLNRNRVQLFVGMVILVVFDSLLWIAREVLARVKVEANIGERLLPDSLPIDLLLNLVLCFAHVGGLLFLKWMWHKVGLTISNRT